MIGLIVAAVLLILSFTLAVTIAVTLCVRKKKEKRPLSENLGHIFTMCHNLQIRTMTE